MAGSESFEWLSSRAHVKLYLFSLLLLSSSIGGQQGPRSHSRPPSCCPSLPSGSSNPSVSLLELKGGGPQGKNKRKRRKEEGWEGDGIEEIEQYGMGWRRRFVSRTDRRSSKWTYKEEGGGGETAKKALWQLNRQRRARAEGSEGDKKREEEWEEEEEEEKQGRNSSAEDDSLLRRFDDMPADQNPEPLRLSKQEGARVHAEALEGNVTAQCQLGLCYLYGTGGFEFDAREGMSWLRRAAEAGDGQAQFCLGVCFWQGVDGSQSNKTALKWFVRAAKKGHELAQVNAGLCFMHGWGVSVQRKKSVTFLTMAARQGNLRAQLTLSLWFKHVYSNFNASSQYNSSYFKSLLGVPPPQAAELSFKWARRAAKAGNMLGMIMTAHCLYNGLGVRANHSKAMSWLDCVRRLKPQDSWKLEDKIFEKDESKLQFLTDPDGLRWSFSEQEKQEEQEEKEEDYGEADVPVEVCLKEEEPKEEEEEEEEEEDFYGVGYEPKKKKKEEEDELMRDIDLTRAERRAAWWQRLERLQREAIFDEDVSSELKDCARSQLLDDKDIEEILYKLEHWDELVQKRTLLKYERAREWNESAGIRRYINVGANEVKSSEEKKKGYARYGFGHGLRGWFGEEV